MPKDTSIGVNEPTWRRLNALKGPGDGFEDVIVSKLDELEELRELVDELQEENEQLRERVGELEKQGVPDDVEPADDVVEADRRDEENGATADDNRGNVRRTPIPEADVEAFESLERPPMSDEDGHRQAVMEAYDLLRNEGPKRKSEIQDALHRVSFNNAGYSNERTWWRKVIKPALKAHPDIQTPAGGNPWKMRE